MTTEVNILIGNRIRQRRITMGMSLKDLANEIGLHYQQMQKYEVGASGLNMRRILQLSHALNVSMDYFFQDIEGQYYKVVENAHSKAGSSRESHEIAKLFCAIKEPSVRKRIADLFRTIADATTDESAY